MSTENDEANQLSLALINHYSRNPFGQSELADDFAGGNGMGKHGDFGLNTKCNFLSGMGQKVPDCLLSCRLNQFLPTGARIRRDMKAFEKKFYERYLSSGYKLCECQVCDTLELKFLIRSESDPDDFQDLHDKYLQRKISKEKIKIENELYQNHTIIFVNKSNL